MNCQFFEIRPVSHRSFGFHNGFKDYMSVVGVTGFEPAASTSQTA
jgi:hypothetical protein